MKADERENKSLREAMFIAGASSTGSLERTGKTGQHLWGANGISNAIQESEDAGLAWAERKFGRIAESQAKDIAESALKRID